MQHFEELAFLGIQRRNLLFSPDVSLSEYLPHEERIAAHWDGVWVAETFSVGLALERLDEFDPWDIAIAATVWLALGDPSRDEVLARIGKTPRESLGAWRQALASLPPGRIESLFGDSWVVFPPPAVEAICHGLGWSGRLSPQLITTLTEHPDAGVRCSLARALAWSQGGVAPSPASLRSFFNDPDPSVRDIALWSAALINPQGAAAWARSEASKASPSGFTIRVVGLLGDESDLPLLKSVLEDEALAHHGVRALGDLGSSQAVDPILDALERWGGPLVPPVRETLTRLVGTAPDTLAETDEEDEQDEPGLRSADYEPPETPRPTPQMAVGERSWWDQARSAFPAHVRWMHGAPFPWGNDPAQEPMGWLWRRLLTAPDPNLEWLRREVPDGFFAGTPGHEAVPGV